MNINNNIKHKTTHEYFILFELFGETTTTTTTKEILPTTHTKITTRNSRGLKKQPNPKIKGIKRK